MIRLKLPKAAPVAQEPITIPRAPTGPRAQREIDTLKLIDAYYFDQGLQLSGRSRGVFHPSGLLKCRRMQQYALIYATENRVQTKVFMRRIWDNGHYVEARLRKAIIFGIEEAGGTWEANLKLNLPGLFLGGETDMVVRFSDGEWILDFKGWNRERYTELTKAPDYYVVQMHAYMLMTNIRQAVLVFENKDSQFLKQIVIKWSQALWDDILERVIKPVLLATYEERLVDRDDDMAVKAGNIPENLCDRKECKFSRVCFTKGMDFEEVDRRPKDHRRRLKVVVEGGLL